MLDTILLDLRKMGEKTPHLLQRQLLPTDVRRQSRLWVLLRLSQDPKQQIHDLNPGLFVASCVSSTARPCPSHSFPLVYTPLWHGRVHSCRIALGWALGQGEPSQEEKAVGPSQAITWELPQLRGHGCSRSLPLGALCTTLINSV